MAFKPAARLVAALALSAGALLPADDARAQQAIGCGGMYEVSRGDTLHRIAVRAYGVGKYTVIFDANRDLLPDTSSLEVGQQLLIPCLDGSGPRNRAEALAAAENQASPPVQQAKAAPEPQPAPEPEITLAAVIADSPGVGMLTGSDFAPFADQRLPEGGMVTELVKLAMARAAPGHPAKVTFYNDWSRHLEFLDSGEFDIGFPWYKPDCTQTARLTGSMRERCAGFVFSDPVFSVAMGYYVRSSDPLATARTHDALAGKRICRPAGYFTFDLDQQDLREPRVTRVVPRTAADCFTLLSQGGVDVVSITTSMAEPEISRLGLDGRVTEVRALATAQTLHAVTAASNTEGRAYIELLDTGLADLKSSGRWFEIVSRQLGAFGMTLR